MVAAVAPLTAPVAPDEALRRVAFLLERERAGSYRVEAFRKAVLTQINKDFPEWTGYIEQIRAVK